MSRPLSALLGFFSAVAIANITIAGEDEPDWHAAILNGAMTFVSARGITSDGEIHDKNVHYRLFLHPGSSFGRNEDQRLTLLMIIIGIPVYLALLAIGYAVAASGIVIPNIVVLTVIVLAVAITAGIVVGLFG